MIGKQHYVDVYYLVWYPIDCLSTILYTLYDISVLPLGWWIRWREKEESQEAEEEIKEIQDKEQE